MSLVGEVAVGVFSNAVYDILTRSLGELRRRRGGWIKLVLQALQDDGLELSRGEIQRLTRWLRDRDLQAMRTSSTNLRAALQRDIEVEVFEAMRPEVLAAQGDPIAWRASVEHRAEDVLAALVSALPALLSDKERLLIRGALASIHSEDTLASVEAELDLAVSHLAQTTARLDPRLPLERAYLRPLPEVGVDPYHLLWPRSGIVPFLDYTGLLADLRAWCDTDQRIAVRIILGRGGSGKTRLGLELCRQLSRRGWLAGVYRAGDPAALAALAREPIPRLIVVDYADLQPDVTRELVGTMIDRLPPRSARVRVVLLVRRHGPTGNPRRWFTGPADRTTQLIDAAAVDSLPTVDRSQGVDRQPTVLTQQVREALYDAALRAYAAIFETTPDSNVPPGVADGTYGTPLLVLMAALLAADTGCTPELPEKQDQLLDRVLEREQRRHWSDSPENDEVTQQRAVVLASLIGADTESDYPEMLKAYPHWRSDASDLARHSLATWLHGLYEGERWINPLEPDLLAEYLVNSHLDRPLVEYTAELRTVSGQARAFTVLGRLMSSRPSAEAIVSDVMVPRLQHLLTEISRQPDGAERARLFGPLTALANQLPMGELALTIDTSPARDLPGIRLSEAIERQAAGYARTQYQLTEDSADRALLIDQLDRWVRSLDRLGRWGEALVAAREAASLARQHLIIDPSPERWARLAGTLYVLSGQLWHNGESDEGRVVAEETVQISRRLANTRPSDALALLGPALNLLSIHLADLGRHREGIVALGEAVELTRATARRPRSREDLANLLNNLSADLLSLGRAEDSLKASAESIGIYEQLEAQDAVKDIGGLARVLDNHAAALFRLGRVQEAAEQSSRAVEIARDLVYRQGLRAVLSILGKALKNLAFHQGALGQTSESIASGADAVAVFEVLVRESPSVHQRELVEVLHNYCKLCELAGTNVAESLAAAERAHDLIVGIDDTDPAGAGSLLTPVQLVHARMLRRAGRYAEAKLHIDAIEARSSHRLNPTERAELLFLRSDCLFALGIEDEADATIDRAMEAAEESARQGSRRSPDSLRLIISMIPARYLRRGEVDQAIGACRDAINDWRELAAEDPVLFLDDLARSLSILTSIYVNHGASLHDSVTSALAAVAARRSLRQMEPTSWRPAFVADLELASRLLRRDGRTAEACDLDVEAVDVLRELLSINESYRPRLASHLSELALDLWERGLAPEGLPYAQEAVELSAPFATAADPHLVVAVGARNHLALCLSAMGDIEESLEQLAAARSLAENLDDDPLNVALRAQIMLNIAVDGRAAGSFVLAADAAQRASKLYFSLMEQGNPEYRGKYAAAMWEIALNSADVAGDEAADALAEAARVFRSLVDEVGEGFLPRYRFAIQEAVLAFGRAKDIRMARDVAHEFQQALESWGLSRQGTISWELSVLESLFAAELNSACYEEAVKINERIIASTRAVEFASSQVKADMLASRLVFSAALSTQLGRHADASAVFDRIHSELSPFLSEDEVMEATSKARSLRASVAKVGLEGLAVSLLQPTSQVRSA